ncbi:Hypothetical protein B839_07560 [Vibrio cholerae O1 str. Inaba G4222]|nr:Hypothetical protein B839_07560 [Vibrio cholerae O1 str. Inaba G4222]CSC65204.1 Uncharacterised protein [Vibrio cholerae]
MRLDMMLPLLISSFRFLVNPAWALRSSLKTPTPLNKEAEL